MKKMGGGDQISFPGLSVSRPLAMVSTKADKGVIALLHLPSHVSRMMYLILQSGIIFSFHSLL